MRTGSFLGVKSGRGMTLNPHPLLVPLIMKEYSYTPTPPIGRTACTEPQCLYESALYLCLTVELYLYPPMGRTACTEPQCLYKGALYLTVEQYLYSPYGPYGLYRASLPVQGCTLILPYSRAIPLLPCGSYGLYRASVPVQGCTLPYSRGRHIGRASRWARVRV
jgi:hypothetical protein